MYIYIEYEFDRKRMKKKNGECNDNERRPGRNSFEGGIFCTNKNGGFDEHVGFKWIECREAFAVILRDKRISR